MLAGFCDIAGGEKPSYPDRRLNIITLSLHRHRFSNTSVCVKTTTATVFGSFVSEEKKSVSFTSWEYIVQDADLGNGSGLFVFKVS